jgi:hypothetical protein
VLSLECGHILVFNRTVDSETGTGPSNELGVDGRVLAPKPMIEVRDVQC